MLKCSKCNQTFESGKFCNMCGSPLEEVSDKLFCKNCGTELEEGGRFCSNCGTAVCVVSEEVKNNTEVSVSVPQETLSEEEKGLSVWTNVLKAALKMPGANVDRDTYLRKELIVHCSAATVDCAIENGILSAHIDRSVLDTIAENTIKYHAAIVTGISFAAGLPGGLAIAATIPADLAQYYWHVIVVSQKLAYIYGWPDLFEDGEEPSDDFLMQMSLFIGVMSGAQGAARAIQSVSKAFAGQVEKRLPQYALTKVGVYNVAKQVAKWLGIRMTKDTFAKGVAKAIPVLGGIVSGGLTLATFPTMANNLKCYLQNTAFMGNEQNVAWNLKMTSSEIEETVDALKQAYDSMSKLYIAREVPKKLEGAKSYAMMAEDEVPVLLWDDTLFGGAKDGFLLSSQRLYIHVYLGESVRFSLSEIRDISLYGDEKNGFYPVINQVSYGICHVYKQEEILPLIDFLRKVILGE